MSVFNLRQTAHHYAYDRRTLMGRHVAAKEQKYRVAASQLLAYVYSSYVVAVFTGWKTRQTVIDRNITFELEFYFRVCSSQFFSRISCVFKCQYLINGKQRITTHMTSSSIFYGKGCVCAGHFVIVSIRNKVANYTKRRACQHVCHVSDDSCRWVLRRAAIVGKVCRRVAVWGINSAVLHLCHTLYLFCLRRTFVLSFFFLICVRCPCSRLTFATLIIFVYYYW